MRFLSPAKVNLRLEILGKRPDGYHEIRSLMLRISLFDELEILPAGEEIRLTAEGEEVPQGPENLACRAALLLTRAAGIRAGLEIRLKKRIPVAAGLGGGSSNAAAVLAGVNELLQLGWPRERLLDLGARIGADVPFFLDASPAIARGIGEKLTAVEMPFPLWFLLLVPPLRISTAWAYAAFDGLPEEAREADRLGARLASSGDLLPLLKNDLERVALPRYPELKGMKEELARRGACGALMSGSGPVVFGLFTQESAAEAAREKIDLPAGWRAVIAEKINAK